MKRILAMAMIAFAALAPAGYAVTIDPIPGSLTYPKPAKPKPPRQSLDTLPIGSVLHHEFRRNGYHHRETYVVEPDGSASITRRQKSWKGGINATTQ